MSRLGVCLALVFAACSSGPLDSDNKDAAIDTSHAADLVSPSGVRCGDTTCALDSVQICCAVSPAEAELSTCQSTSARCAYSSFACDDPSDCAGGVCCAVRTASYVGTRCQTSCDPDTEATACATPADCGGRTCFAGFWFSMKTCGSE